MMMQLKLIVVILVALFCFTSCASTGPHSTLPKLVRSFPPQYPYSAKKNNIEGGVTLRFVVTTDGTARDIEVVESSPEGVFDLAVLKAVEKYIFKPGTMDRNPVDTEMKLTFVYSIENGGILKIVDD